MDHITVHDALLAFGGTLKRTKCNMFLPQLIHCPPETLFMIARTQVMCSSSARTINILRFGHHGDDEQCPPCKCKNGISFKRTAWTNDNPVRRFWDYKNLMSSERPRCEIFKWKDKDIEEGYYKDQIRKMRYEL
ncbi:unnamed protein product [Lactuca virosa]|uniref:Uncharacterized protein n=1 Tax=Lactuca virosa TaxID=75947 RepID=A0AAU9P3G7_9ASTR|nr:unnamed protein product [Lactuca virosa]